MADIASSLLKLANAIIKLASYEKANRITPFTFSPAVANVPQCITASIAPTGLKVFYISLKVRSLGTATYVAVGDSGAREERLTSTGEIYEAEAPKQGYLATNEIMIESDATDPVIEVGGVMIPGE